MTSQDALTRNCNQTSSNGSGVGPLSARHRAILNSTSAIRRWRNAQAGTLALLQALTTESPQLQEWEAKPLPDSFHKIAPTP